MTLTLFQKFEAAIAKDEQWVLAEFTKGWSLLQTVGHTAEVDIEHIFGWIQSHQGDILKIFHDALGVLASVGGLVPGIGPEIVIATTAINAATAGINILAKAVIAGSTPLSVAVNAYHAVKDAQTAVNGVLKHATTDPKVLQLMTNSAVVLPPAHA
jgi:hypothetical protein